MYISGKIFMKYDQQFLSGRVRHCWCLAEVCAPHMISKYYEDFLGSRCISGKNFMKIQSVVIQILGELLYP